MTVKSGGRCPPTENASGRCGKEKSVMLTVITLCGIAYFAAMVGMTVHGLRTNG